MATGEGKSAAQILLQIARLAEEQSVSASAQKEVLKEGLNTEAIYDRFGEEALGDDFDQEQLDAALDADIWRSGQMEDEWL